MNARIHNMKSGGFIHGDWHGWYGASNEFLLSDESGVVWEKCSLASFKTIDDAINWLYLNNQKDAARALNTWKKGA